MISNEERRALAAHLRDFERARSFAADKVLGRPGSLVDADDVLLNLFDEDWEGYGIHDVGFVRSCAVLHLAAIIDRPTCKMLDHETSGHRPNGQECSRCGEVFILTWRDAWNYCPNCGAEVIE